jgi:outer membrane protein assembly factor BamB
MFGSSKKKIKLKLVAQVRPPEVMGERVQATSVAIEGADKAMVSYNMRGAPRLGAIDWITRLQKKPRISASATFKDSDVSALSWDGTFVYAAESTSSPEFPYPAVFERLKLANDKFTLEENLRIPLTSYVTTSTLRTSSQVYATSGDGGHVFAFDESSMELLGQYPLDDARWAAWDKDGKRVVVVQGTPGRISVFAEGEFPDGSMNLLNTFEFPGANVPESKSTADIAGDKAFIAAGPDGVQIVCLNNGRVVGSVPRPDPASLGLDPSVVVTNAVTVDEDLMFISNGEAGVYIARGSEEFKDTGCSPQTIEQIGRLEFPDLQSANHVEFENDHLIIAAGLGGVKVVRVKVR